jgi:protein involved in polysaccharide export with SLBB domain
VVFAWLAMFVFIAGIHSQVQAPVEPSWAQSPANSAGRAQLPTQFDEYLIDADDVLSIYVLDVPELSREYRVNSAGRSIYLVFHILCRPKG